MENNEVSRFQVQGKVKHITGSILMPEYAGLRFVLSVNNLAGKPEGNPLLPIFDKKWKQVRSESRGWWATKTGAYKLGAVSNVAVQSDVWVIGMLCMNEDFKVDAKGLETCLKEVYKLAKAEKASVHISDLLTEKMPELTELVGKHLVSNGTNVSYYEER